MRIFLKCLVFHCLSEVFQFFFVSVPHNRIERNPDSAAPKT